MKIVRYPTLRAEMARRGITQTDFAKLLNLSQNYMCDKINGKREFKLNELRVIADEIGLPIDILFAEDKVINQEGRTA